ncbi:MAG: HAD-IC family P-type ATPase, partial [Chloroflexi bacterium]|nr:HAD-IC family P-type ATPase [Chloroflexota bacterium]
MPVASWHNMAVNDAAALLKTDPVAGLGEKEAAQRLERYGPNEIRSRRTTAIPALILAQFTDLMVMVLLAATAVSIFVREYDQAVTIMAIVVLNAVLGFVQEYRADRSLAALREYSAPTARAVREGRNLELPPAALVPGDLIILEAGDRVPADARLVHSASLEVDESVLTGESVPLEKEPSPVDPGATVPERRCMVFQGTLVTRGRGRALVAATGMATEIGRIAGLLDEAVVEPTPLQIRLAGLGKVLVWVAALICSAVVALGILRGEPPYRMLMAGISLAVAAIPEGLPAVVTISLALGVQRMLSRNAIVRRLPAVETLGCATVICSDKTGTLTQNRMALVEIRSSKGRLRASDHGAFRNPEARGILEAVAACNNATLVVDEPSIIDTLKRKLGLRRKEPAGLSSSPGMPGRSVQSNRPVTSGRPVTPGRSATKGRPAASGFDRSPTRQPAGTASRAGDGGTAATVGPAVSIPPVRDPYPIRAEGDPTEAALLSAAVTAGVKPESLGPRLAEYPFDSGRKLMTVVNRRPGGAIAYVKGAPERVLPLCRLEPAARAEILAAGEEMARRALRVLAVAERSLGPW